MAKSKYIEGSKEVTGWPLVNLPYKKQLKLKEGILKNIFGFEIPIVKNPSPFGYRTRMDLVYAFGKIGLRRKGNYKHVVEIDYCPLMSEKANRILKLIKDNVRKLNIEGYDYITHKGFVRYFVIREAKEELMLNIVVAKYEKKDRNALLKLIQLVEPLIDSINILLNKGLSDTNYGTIIESFKKNYIIEEYGKNQERIRLLVYPNSFLQSNSKVALKMYKEIKKFCYGKCLDLYSGIGSIALFIAKNKRVRKVDAVEVDDESVSAFNKNISLNNLEKKVEVYKSNVREFLNKAIDEGRTYDVIISDPPRAGMGKKVCRKLLKLSPARLVLVSCNPRTLKSDFDILKECYSLKRAIAFDMFSQTEHIEVLFVLEKDNQKII